MTTSIAELRRRVGDQLADALRVIAELRRDLEQSRAEARELRSDRDRLQRALVQIDVLELARTEAEAQARASRQGEVHAQQLQEAAEADNELLVERCQRLERALAKERADLDAARLDIDCLEQQVEQLQSMVDMLSGKGKAE